MRLSPFRSDPPHLVTGPTEVLRSRETSELVSQEFVAQKFGTAAVRVDPPIGVRSLNFIIRLARENSDWGYDRIAGALQNLGHYVSDQTVGNILRCFGIAPAPKRRLHMNWDACEYRHVGADEVIQPARSPNLNAFAERWVRTIKTECLSKLILFGEAPLRRAVTQFLGHYHLERPHQGKGNQLLFPAPIPPRARQAGPIQCHERLAKTKGSSKSVRIVANESP